MKRAQEEDPFHDDQYSLGFAELKDYRLSFDILLSQVENTWKPMLSSFQDISSANIFCGLGGKQNSCEFRWIYIMESVCFYHAWYRES